MTKEEMHDWFFNYRLISNPELDNIYIEDMYQAFKTRLAAEATMNLWLVDGER